MRVFLLFLALCFAFACGSSQQRVLYEEEPELYEPPEPPEIIGRFYTVKKGDTAVVIAERFNLPFEDLVEANLLESPEKLAVGQELFLYGVDEIVARSEKKRMQSAALPAPKKSAPRPKLRWPLDRGVISSTFGKRSGHQHRGIDIAVKPGTVIVAAAQGEVIYSDNKQSGYGNLVILRHDGGMVTVYAHNRKNLVQEGDKVRQGDPIAEVGNTGRSTGPHLHFEVRIDNKPVDPMKYLPAR